MSVTFDSEYIQRVANVVRTKLTDASEEEITSLSYACIFRLRHSGIKNLNPNDHLIKQAIRFYAKGYYGLDPDQRSKDDFEKLAIDLSVDSDYITGEERYE